MTSTLFVIQIILAILITIAVLMQKSSSIGLGAYSGSNESVFGAKGPAGFLTKLTFTLALLFVINTLALGYMYSKESQSSVIDTVKTGKTNKSTAQPIAVPHSPVKTVPTAPKASEGNSSK